MKKSLLMGAALISALTFVSCKSSESSYKKAYEKAQAMQQAEQDTNPVDVAPVVTTPVQEEVDNSDLRSERLDVMNGGNLKAYNVVCGSFRSSDNANRLRNTLVGKGYDAQVAQNPATGMYRVVASSFDTRSAANTSLNTLRRTYPDAWLLLRQY